MANAARWVTIDPYPFNGTFLYGYSRGTYTYGQIDDGTFILNNGNSVRLNAIRYYSLDASGIPEQPTIYLRLDGDASISGITSITINGATYLMSNALQSVAGSGGGGQAADVLYSSWKWAAPFNPFSEGAGAVDYITFNNVLEDYGLIVTNDYGHVVVEYTSRLSRYVASGFIFVLPLSYGEVIVTGMTNTDDWDVVVDTGMYDRAYSVTKFSGYFRIYDNTSGGVGNAINYWVVRK